MPQPEQDHNRREVIEWLGLMGVSAASTYALWRTPGGTIYETEANQATQENELAKAARENGAIDMSHGQEVYVSETSEQQKALEALFASEADLFETRKKIEEHEGQPFHFFRSASKILAPLMTLASVHMIAYRAIAPRLEEIYEEVYANPDKEF